MLNLDPAISKIEELLKEGTEATITYAALECRLAIERICYERLRLAHDYISHDDLKKWQPRDIVKILIQEVDSSAAETFTVSISTSVTPEGTTDLTIRQWITRRSALRSALILTSWVDFGTHWPTWPCISASPLTRPTIFAITGTRRQLVRRSPKRLLKLSV